MEDIKDPGGGLLMLQECFSEQVETGRKPCVQGAENVKRFLNRNSLFNYHAA